jgi:hypothetical protein
MSKVWYGATAPRQTRSILRAAESSHCSGAGLRPRLEREPPISAKEPLRTAPCGYRRLLCQSESATLAIATAAHAIQSPKWTRGRDTLQATSHDLWLTSSCLAMHHANRFVPGGSSKPNATGESRACGMGYVLLVRASSFEPAVLSQYYCLDSNSRPASVIPRQTYQHLILPLLYLSLE